MNGETEAKLHLNQAEWQAVAIALRDAERCDCVDGPGAGRLARAYRWLTGSHPTNPLADPRLEAIRSFVCDTRRHRRVADRFAPALAAQGLNRRQIEALALLTI